jgi:hypothetical protein
MPFDEDDGDGDEEVTSEPPAGCADWTAFHYDSSRSLFVPLNEVEIGEDSEYLSFEFNIHDWAAAMVDPLQSAVEQNSEEQTADNQGVDVTQSLENGGYSAEMLFNDARVSSIRQGARRP